jgi:hypothetical protein
LKVGYTANKQTIKIPIKIMLLHLNDLQKKKRWTMAAIKIEKKEVNPKQAEN